MNPAHYQKLISAVGDLQACEFVNFWSLSGASHETEPIAVEPAFYSLLFLAQVIGERNSIEKTNIWVISNGLAQLGRGESLSRDKAILLGPCRTIPLEYENVRCCLVDVGFSELDVETLVSVCSEVPPSTFVACRLGQPWVQCFEPVALPPVSNKVLHVRDGGVYLITGGLGGIGLTLAKWLAREAGARLVLLGRSLPPPRAEWDELIRNESTPAPVRYQISVLRELEEAGNAPLVCKADVGEESEVRGAVEQAMAQFGAIHGIIHAAGVAGGGLIQFKTTSAIQAVLRPKIEGTLILERIFQDFDLDFFVACSSVASVQGAFGQIDYCAANAFLDAFCLSNRLKPSTPTYSIGWDAWKEVGMARNASLSANLERFRLQRLSTALSTKDGIEAFARILSVEKPRLHVLVSNEDLTLLPQPDSSDPETQHHLPVSAPTHPRPELKGDLVLPRNEAEQSIAEVWQAVLGIQGIGVNDDFWELGGHSLLATQVVSRLKERFHVPLPLRALFEMPTVAKLAEEMARLQDSQVSPGASGEQDFELPSIQRVDRNGKLVLSYGQERLWFIYQLEPENIAYNIHTAVRIKGPLHLDSLERTLREVVQRHESLRTRFVNLDGELQQVIESSMVVELPVTDLSHLGEGEREAEARKAAIHEARQPFDLERGPLFRAKLLRLAGENHVLVFNMHHIVSDQWSIGILVREVSLIYNSFSTGKPSPLPDLDIQYADFSAWQRQWLHGEVLERQLDYWKKQLAAASVLELPTDRPRNLSQIQKGEVIEFNLPVELLAQLKQLCLQQGATLYMCLLAAFQLLLYRWSGQDDVTVGAPIAGRRRTETETLIGFFLNTLVLRTDLSGSPTFLQLLRRVREVTLGAYAHQDVPFEKLVEELSPERDLHRPPFFQVIFFMQNVPMTDLYLGEKTTVELFASDTAAAKLDITVVFEERASATVGSVLYNADLYDAETIAQMVEQYQALLTAIAARPEEIIDSCPLVPESVYRGYVEKWNQPLGSEERALAAHAISHGSINSSVSPNSKAISGITKRPLFVHEMFQQIAEQHPDFIAVDSADGDLTYSQLNQRSNQIAARLWDMGVRKNESVVVCAESRKFMIESVLGILKAGAAFVPLSPGVPAARLKGLVDQCNPKWALVAPDAAERFNALAVHSVQVVSTDSVADAASYKPGEESHGDDFSYIFFTSGSTGKPKAIAGRLKALDQFMRWEISTFAMGPGTRVSQLMSPMFDAFMRDVFAPLCSGGTVCIPPSQEVLLDGRQLGNWIREKRIAVIHTVPTLFRTLINQSPEEGGWPDLRYMLLSGEPLLPADVKKWHDVAGSGPRLVNLYGASEVTMCKFMYLVNESDHLRRLIPVGKPIADTTAVAIDNAGKICAPGSIGELYIRTPFRALGYFNEPELTAKVFVQNPFSQEDGDIVYKTGDLARPRADGSFELVGRRDHQVKIRGVRIELGEVEKAVNECPGVAEAVVTAREVSPGENRLVGYFVPGKGLQLSASALIASLRQRLPDYMIPTAWVMLEKMPLSPNGKIDRKNLPEPDADVPQHDYVAPRNPTEETLCTLWQEILRHKRVGIHDSFFTIGGHSLLAAQVATRLRETFKVEIPLRRIFELPTVAQLAEEISQALKAAGTNGAQPPVLPSIKRVQRKAALMPVERD
jgi:amino acid adenylation domain-containing protein